MDDEFIKCPICGHLGVLMALPNHSPKDYAALMLHATVAPRRVCKLKQGQLPKRPDPFAPLDVAELMRHARAAGLEPIVLDAEETTE